MRINVYSQELTSEVLLVSKCSNTGRVFNAAQLILHSSDKLHHSPIDDDRSAVTFWMPGSAHRCLAMAAAFESIAAHFRDEGDRLGCLAMAAAFESIAAHSRDEGDRLDDVKS